MNKPYVNLALNLHFAGARDLFCGYSKSLGISGTSYCRGPAYQKMHTVHMLRTFYQSNRLYTLVGKASTSYMRSSRTSKLYPHI